MQKSLVGRCAGVVVVFTLLGALMQTSIFAQKSGPAAKGGSLARGRIVEDHTEQTEPAPEKYRDAVRELELNYDELVEEYSSSRSLTHPPSFKTVVLVHLIARELAPTAFKESATQLLTVVKRGSSIDQALRQIFNLSGQAAKRNARAAEKQFEQAIDRVRRK